MNRKHHIENIVLIGAGNAATHLGSALQAAGLNIVQVFSRNADKAAKLAARLKSAPCHDWGEITDAGDLYILAVHDDAIAEVSGKLFTQKFNEKLFVHVSGATPVTAVRQRRRGVFYPLQTFTVGKKTAFREIPLCIDAAEDVDRALLQELASRISDRVYYLIDEQRTVVHVAAVFANNFSNHLFAIAKTILEKENLPFELLKPLIRETVEKLEYGDPDSMQTGPAVRKDFATIERHLSLLEKYPAYREIYLLLTNSIQHN